MNHFSIFVQDLRHIFEKKRGLRGSFSLFTTHIRLKFKQKVFEMLRIKRTSEKVLGLTVAFPDYGGFCHLWREIFVREYYYFRYLGPRPRILDVGSNIGMSVCYFKLLYPEAQIVCFEPDPMAFRWLQKNVALNRFTGVELHNVALAAKEGRSRFYQEVVSEASGLNSLKPEMLPEDRREVEVETKKLSSFLDNEVALLKIDAEGAEYEILMEAQNKLTHAQNILLEMHQIGGRTNDPIHSVLEILDGYGFRYAITETFISHHEFMENSSRSYAVLVAATAVRKPDAVPR